MKAIDRGHYGKCVRCGEEINDKRLEAVPWAKMCIGCEQNGGGAHFTRGHGQPRTGSAGVVTEMEAEQALQFIREPSSIIEDRPPPILNCHLSFAILPGMGVSPG